MTHITKTTLLFKFTFLLFLISLNVFYKQKTNLFKNNILNLNQFNDQFWIVTNLFMSKK